METTNNRVYKIVIDLLSRVRFSTLASVELCSLTVPTILQDCRASLSVEGVGFRVQGHTEQDPRTVDSGVTFGTLIRILTFGVKEREPPWSGMTINLY